MEQCLILPLPDDDHLATPSPLSGGIVIPAQVCAHWEDVPQAVHGLHDESPSVTTIVGINKASSNAIVNMIVGSQDHVLVISRL